MSSFNSDKCDKKELQIFKQQVINWLDANFPDWRSKFKIKAFVCYNGDARLYDGTFEEFLNTKSSFRRSKADINQDGKIIGWRGTRGIHSRKYANYISINRDEFSDVKNAFSNSQNDSYDFYYDLIFRRLK